MQNTRFWGCDLGTTNVALSYLEGEKAYSYFSEFKPDLDPYEIHTVLKDHADGLPLEEGDVLAIEAVFAGPNQRTFARMTRVAHSVNLLFAERGARVFYLDNNAWRKILYGTSRIKKEACIERALERWTFLGQYPKKTRGHRSDSLSLALAAREIYKESPSVCPTQPPHLT